MMLPLWMQAGLERLIARLFENRQPLTHDFNGYLVEGAFHITTGTYRITIYPKQTGEKGGKA